GHVHCDLVMGVPGGTPGTATALTAAIRDLPAGCTWSATGIGRSTLPVMFAALAAGGHLRVGMEDVVTFARGRPVRDNAELVERVVAQPDVVADKVAHRGPAAEHRGVDEHDTAGERELGGVVQDRVPLDGAVLGAEHEHAGTFELRPLLARRAVLVVLVDQV